MKFLITLFLSILTSILTAQTVNTNTYPLSGYSNIALEDLSIAPIAIGPGVSHASYSSVIPFGSDFKFCYNGVCYETLRAQVAGKISLGDGIIFAMYGTDNIIAPLSNRMTTGSNGWVKYSLMGVAPHRKFVVEWKVRMQTNSLTGSAIHQMQLWLHEDGRIDFVYGNTPSWNGTVYQNYSVGLSYRDITSGTTTVTVGTPISTSIANYAGTSGNQTTTILPQSMLSFIPDTTPVAAPPFTFEEVSPSCLTMRLIDTTTNEYGYRVYRSDDGINYNNLIAQISSVTPNVSDTFYINDSELIPNTTYHYAVIAYGLALVPDTLHAIITTPPPLLAGVYNIPGDYETINEALEDIYCSQLASDVYLELNDSYDFSQEVLPIKIDHRILTSSTQTLTIRPSSTSAGIVLNNVTDTSVFILSKASYFRLDGRPGGLGSEEKLTLNQLNSYNPVIVLKDTSTDNTITHTVMKGKGSMNHLKDDCLLYFHPSNLSHNKVENCSFTNLPNGWLKFAVVSGTGEQFNDSNQIVNCNFSNYGIQIGKTYSSNPVAAIKILNKNSGWRIEGNSFFFTDTLHTIDTKSILIEAPEGENFSIKNNWFGGSEPRCNGNNMVVSTSGHNSGSQQIYLNLGPNTTHRVSKNTVDKIHVIITDYGTKYSLVQIKAEKIIIDSNVVGNSAGDETMKYDFINTQGTPKGVPIFYTSGVHTNLIIRDNIIHNVKTTGKLDLLGIQVSSGNPLPKHIEISNNRIGGSFDNSLYSEQEFYGIKIGYGILDTVVIKNNHINNYYGKLQAIGISGYAGDFEEPNNLSHFYLTNNIISNGYSNLASVGCEFDSDYGAGVIKDNDIFNLKTLNGDDYNRGAVIGIATINYQHSGFCIVDGNKVHHLDALLPRATIEGMFLHGNGITQNNMIALGRDKFGNFINDSIRVTGITMNASPNADTVIVKHNSVYLTGDSVDYESAYFINSVRSRAVYCVMRPNVHFTNNLIVTYRSNAIGDFGTSGNFTLGGYCDYNQYFSNRPDFFGEETIISELTFDEWNIDYGQDMHSFFMPPYFINPDGDSMTWDLHLQPHNYSEGNGLITSIQSDIDGDDRMILSPADIGADAGNFYSIPMINLGPDSLYLCQGDSIYLTPGSNYASYEWNTEETSEAIYVNTSGTYSVTITDMYGYTSTDSIVILAAPSPDYTLPTDTTMCLNVPITLTLPLGYDSYDWSNGDSTHISSITSPGVYSVSVGNSYGCFHNDTLTIVMDSLYNYTFTQNHMVCGNDSISITMFPNEFTYVWNETISSDTAVLYPNTTTVFNVISPSGCSVLDSITVSGITIDITSTYLSICAGDSVLIYGSYESSGGIYIDTVSSIQGCDSILKTVLTINPIITTQLPSIEICAGDSTLLFGEYLSSGGIYTNTLQTVDGCDSILAQELIVLSPPNVQLNDFNPNLVCIDNGTITLPAGFPLGGTYSGTGVSGVFDPLVSGIGIHYVYYFYTDENGCTSSDSSIISIDGCLSNQKLEANPVIQAMPNPSNGVFYIYWNDTPTEKLELNLYDITGKNILNQILESEIGHFQIDIQNRDNGVYFLIIGSKVMKLVKNK